MIFSLTSVLFQAISLLYPKIVDMFHFAGEKHSTPNCPIELRPNLNPSSGVQSYSRSDPMCLKPAHYYIPFFLSKLGPKFSEWTIGAHEAQPGHHLQVNNMYLLTDWEGRMGKYFVAMTESQIFSHPARPNLSNKYFII